MIDQTWRVYQGVFGSILTFGLELSVTLGESDKICNCQVSNNWRIILFSATSE